MRLLPHDVIEVVDKAVTTLTVTIDISGPVEKFERIWIGETKYGVIDWKWVSEGRISAIVIAMP